ncbi:hypothetical protein ACWEV3_34180 [Saccharopolyspora sp. NPDC003752]
MSYLWETLCALNLTIYLRAGSIAPCQAPWWWTVVVHSAASIALAVIIQLFQVNWARIALSVMGVASAFLAIYGGLRGATIEMILQIVLVGTVPFLFFLDREPGSSPDMPDVDIATKAGVARGGAMRHVLATVVLQGLVAVSMVIGAVSTVADMDRGIVRVRPTVCETGI